MHASKTVHAALQRAVAHVGVAACQITSLTRRGTLADIERKASLLFLEELWKCARNAVRSSSSSSSTTAAAAAVDRAAAAAATASSSSSSSSHHHHHHHSNNEWTAKAACLEDPMPVLLASAELVADYNDDFKALNLVKGDTLVLDHRANNSNTAAAAAATTTTTTDTQANNNPQHGVPFVQNYFRDCVAQCPCPLLHVVRPSSSTSSSTSSASRKGGQQSHRMPPLYTAASLMTTKLTSLVSLTPPPLPQHDMA